MSINFDGLQSFLTDIVLTIERAEKATNELNAVMAKYEAMRADLDKTKEATQRIVLASEIPVDEYAEIIAIYPEWKEGIQIQKGRVYRVGGQLYEAMQSHVAQDDWKPPAGSLFKPATHKIYANGEEIIYDFKQPKGALDAYKKGQRVRFNGVIYESTIDANTWSPKDYPRGWKEV